jgi:large subunit ribosomal protein L35
VDAARGEKTAMPKMKTNKTAAKRIKITATGKMMRRHTRRGHLMINKDPNRKRFLRTEEPLAGGDAARMRRMLPNSF